MLSFSPVLAILLCAGTAHAPEVRSPAGLTVIYVRGNARNIVLIDPRGRVNRSEARTSESTILGCDRWDGGTRTTLDLQSGTDRFESGDLVTELDLTHPILGRYLLSADLGGAATVELSLSTATPANDACFLLESRVEKVRGRVAWTIDFVSAGGDTSCPVTLARARRVSRR